MKKIFSKLNWKVEGMDYNDKPSSPDAVFHLKYNNEVIGILTYTDDLWHFNYTDTFKSLQLSPLSNFPDLDKTYSSESLWPFFASRIPSLNQSFYTKKLNKVNANKNDSVDLLKVFGKRTITNPYHLDFI
ncbi:MAG: HipA N-terminal domain-containing protein [Bacteroidales bacterium]|nr:HipA N-terminal domain-containing protein [Bacteroidales bacterium]MDD4216424.1 HipA N-terminal domain-containing protein [Bacteroidales bacterium]MDY0142582.1 HipA N-terminal domain-containing protein [Bacteroidales bacterium]